MIKSATITFSERICACRAPSGAPNNYALEIMVGGQNEPYGSRAGQVTPVGLTLRCTQCGTRLTVPQGRLTFGVVFESDNKPTVEEDQDHVGRSRTDVVLGD
jgi:hypothetical protein